MKVGSFRTVRWSRCLGLALVGWLVLYAVVYVGGGIVDYYRPDLMEKYFYGFFRIFGG